MAVIDFPSTAGPGGDAFGVQAIDDRRAIDGHGHRPTHAHVLERAVDVDTERQEGAAHVEPAVPFELRRGLLQRIDVLPADRFENVELALAHLLLHRADDAGLDIVGRDARSAHISALQPLARQRQPGADLAAEARSLAEGRRDVGAVVSFSGICRDDQGALAALDSHHGHTALTTRLVHSLTLDPPNKPRVSVPEALRRARLFGRMERDLLVSAGVPLYVHKAERFPGSPMVLGADAAMKVLDPCWGVNPREALATFERLGTKL